MGVRSARHAKAARGNPEGKINTGEKNKARAEAPDMGVRSACRSCTGKVGRRRSYKQKTRTRPSYNSKEEST
ncbi:hypothetical protein NDU88_005965 [Pleurodeles waltl]|uniref:Uncharacterized protein n=1 Tax=Pleurodeles waltl TaxID=8319 RepID=A0AAV7LYT8_PLEWA|nr:hypothetical protein NDU88_005965 [Pleurodeles waltl]